MLFAGCDDITTQESDDPISILSFEITPSQVEFPSDLSEKDTTVTVTLNLELKEETKSEIRYSLIRNRETLQENVIEPVSGAIYQANFDLNLNTARSEQYSIYLYPTNALNSDVAEASIRVISKLGVSPEIVEAFNTETVQIPQDNSQERVDFFARVVHPVSQELIEKVEFLLIDSAGNSIGKFEMFDDGDFDESDGSIDEVAGDSLYSRALFVDQTNNPDTYDVLYYAIGTNGVSSDTVQTILQIVE